MKRIPQLDGLRGIAILMVFLAHAFNVPLFWMGVDLFFVLSGYLITGILLRLKEKYAAGGSYWRAFYSRRARRILPPYIALLLVLSILSHVPWKHVWYWYVFFAPNIPLAFGKLPVAAMAPLWSLGVEEQFYFVWPMLVLACTRDTLRYVTIAIIAIAPMLRAVCTPMFASHFPIYSLTIFRADTLGMGAFIAIAVNRNPRWVDGNSRRALSASVAALVLLMGFSILPSFRAGANSVLFNSVAYSFSAVLFGGGVVYSLGTKTSTLRSLLTFAPLRYLGVISYTFYLYHEAVLLRVAQYLHSQMGTALAAFLITGIVAALSWHFFENPILKRKWVFSVKSIAPAVGEPVVLEMTDVA